MDYKTFEKIKVALYSIPYEKLSNQNISQNESDIILESNTIHEDNIIDTVKNFPEKTNQFKNRKSACEGVNKENLTQNQTTENNNGLKVKSGKSIPKYLVPIVVIKPPIKSKAYKRAKHGKKVKFSPLVDETLPRTDKQTNVRKRTNRNKNNIRPTVDLQGQVNSTSLNEFGHTNNQAKLGVPGSANRPTLGQTCPTNNKQRLVLGSDPTNRPRLQDFSRPTISQLKFQTTQKLPRTVRKFPSTENLSLDVQKREIKPENLSFSVQKHEMSRSHSLPKRHPTKFDPNRERKNQSIEKVPLKMKNIYLDHPETKSGYNRLAYDLKTQPVNSHAQHSTQQFRHQSSYSHINRTHRYTTPPTHCSNSQHTNTHTQTFSSWSTQTTTSTQPPKKPPHYHHTTTSSTSFSHTPHPLQYTTQPSSAVFSTTPSVLQHTTQPSSAIFSTTPRALHHTTQTSSTLFSTTSHPLQQLERSYHLSFRHETKTLRCECNSWSKQYGSQFCSQKRTTKSGIAPLGGVEGRNPLWEYSINRMVKQTIKERLLLHGVGCRYRQSRLHHPWFLQEDCRVAGPIYFRVLPGLYVGNFRDSKDQEQLNKHHITHILAIHDNARKLPCNSNKEYLCIIASDSPGQNLTQFFPICNDFIHTARLKGGNILIHCLAGMSRSVTVAVVYVMCVTSLRWRDALKAVQGARNVANPNVGFLKQLQEFEKDRLQEEKRRIREKYPDWTVSEEDELMVKELLTSYDHYMSVGEMCDGNCQQGTVCPRGLCNQPRSIGIFRRNSRETSHSRSTSPMGKRSSSLANMSTSPKGSPEQSRNPSPTSTPMCSRVSTNTLSPSMLPYQSQRPPPNGGNENFDSFVAYPDSPSRSRKACGSFYGQPTPPGSPSRSYGYYTSSPSKSPTSSPSAFGCGGGGSPGSPSRSFKQGKVLHCPSTPPSSPARSSCRRNTGLSQLTPPSSPMRVVRNKAREESGKESITRNSTNISNPGKKGVDQGNKRNARMSFKDELGSLSPQKRISRLCNRESKSLDLSTPPGSPVKDRGLTKQNASPQRSVPSSPAKQKNRPHGTKGSPSRFCQVVTKLLPQIVTLNTSSRLCKNIAKPFSRAESAALYVDEKGRSSLKPTTKKTDETGGLSSTSSVESRLSTTPILTLDEEDEEARVVIFELCKNIQKLPKETEMTYEPTKDIVESDIVVPERKSSMHTTIDISTYTNTTNTNIIINPIFSLENKYEADSLCNNKSTGKFDGKQNYSAFLEDDIIYVQTTEASPCKESKPKQQPSNNNNTSQPGVIIPESTIIPIPHKMDIRVNPYDSEKFDECNKLLIEERRHHSFVVEDSSSDSDLSPNQTLQRDFSICKRNSSFKPENDASTGKLKEYEGTCSKQVSFDSNIRNNLGKDNKTPMDAASKQPRRKSETKLPTRIKNSIPAIHSTPGTSKSTSSSSVSRPPCGPPPPLPPRKGNKNPSTNDHHSTPPPIPPRSMKPHHYSQSTDVVPLNQMLRKNSCPKV